IRTRRSCYTSFFFFSSRRRHTRSKRDWSSDVCSSDLPRVIALELSVLGSHGMAAADYPQLVDLVVWGHLRPQELVTAVIGLDDAPETMEAMGRPAGSAGMTIIDLNRGERSST